MLPLRPPAPPARRSLAALALILAGLGLSSAGPGRAPPPAEPWPAGLRPGLTPGEVGKLLHDPPARVSRQVVAHRSVEQWHYGPPRGLRLTFLSFRGQPPRLQSVHSAARPQPGP